MVKNIVYLEYGERNGIMAETTVDVYIIFDESYGLSYECWLVARRA